MPRIDLNVPFAEKDDAKRLGARWDGMRRVWYVPVATPSASPRRSAGNANHCEACGMKQGDFGLFCEPGGPFSPMDERAASRVVLHMVSEPFNACADTAYGDFFFENMRRA